MYVFERINIIESESLSSKLIYYILKCFLAVIFITKKNK